MQRLNAFQLKLLMAGLMVFDHLHDIPGLVGPMTAGILHVLTRCVAVWFAFAAVEGFIHTRDRIRYALRLIFASLIMTVGNTLLNLLLASHGLAITNNIFTTLAAGVVVLTLFFADDVVIIKSPWLRIPLGIFITILGMVGNEGGLVILPFMLITYAFRANKVLRNSLYFLLSAVLFALSFSLYPSTIETITMLLYNSDWFFISVLPFIALYNGQRGPKTRFSQYFFYVFYPLHLWVIYVIAYLVS